MDEFLARLGVQAVNYAMRCGIAMTSSFALEQCSRLLKTVDNKVQYAELRVLQKALDNKIQIISPALDLIEFRSGRGNVFLGNAARLAKVLHRDISILGKRLEKAAASEELCHTSGRAVNSGHQQAELSSIIGSIKALLTRIDSQIPLIQLALTASGESLSTSLPASISPSRLLQASMLLTLGDTQFDASLQETMQVGPSFTLSIYMLFIGHTAPQDMIPLHKKPVWQEVLHKARVRLCRTAGRASKPEADALSDEITEPNARALSTARRSRYSYHLEILEDLDDGRFHDEEEQQEYSDLPDEIRQVGIRESIPIHQIAKIFYTDTGRILNIGGGNSFDNNAVLLLKRDLDTTVPTRGYGGGGEETEEQETSGATDQKDVDRQLRVESGCFSHAGCFPRHLDPEWLALEVLTEDDEGKDDTDDTATEDEDDLGCGRTVESFRDLTLSDADDSARPLLGTIASSLSLLEMLIRLTSLQEFQQTSHLSIPDHILSFFLEETSTTGLHGEAHWRAKREAEHRMGFDPYTNGKK